MGWVLLFPLHYFFFVILKKKIQFLKGLESVAFFSRARSVLAETEEPAVLTQNYRTETEIEPINSTFLRTGRNRNRFLEPRVTETAVFGEKINEISSKNARFCQISINLNKKYYQISRNCVYMANFNYISNK